MVFKEPLLPSNVVLVVHHPLWIVRAGGDVHRQRYKWVVDYVRRMRDLGVFVVYFAYPQHFNQLFFSNCDFFVFQARGKAKTINWNAPLLPEKKVNRKKIARTVWGRLKKGEGVIVYSHKEAATKMAQVFEKEFGDDLRRVYVIGGPVEGCLPMNIYYLNNALKGTAGELKMIDDLVVREHPNTNPFNLPPEEYCSMCKLPAVECMCGEEDKVREFKVDVGPMKHLWQGMFSKYHAEDIYHLLEDNERKRME